MQGLPLAQLRMLENSILNNPYRCVMMTDASGALLMMNRTGRKWLGFGEDEDVTTIKDVTTMVDPDFLVAEARRLTALLKRPIEPSFETLILPALIGSPEERDFIWLNKSGQPVTVSMAVPVAHGESGDVAGYVLLLTDISQRIIQSGMLQESESRYQTVVEVMEEGIVLQDATGTVLTCNASAEKMLGLTMEQMNDPLFSAVPWTALDEDETPFPRAKYPLAVTLATGKPCSHVIMGLRQLDGSVTWLSINSIPLFRTGDDKPHAVMMSLTDITERRHFESELARARDAALEAARVKSAFLANSSHEIRTPLNAIIGMLDLLKGTDLTRQQRSFIESSQNSAEVLLSVINDLLDLSKIEAGKYALESGDLSLQTVIEEAAGSVAARAYSKGLELITFIEPEVPNMLRGDEARLRHVLINLLSNAVKFTDMGEITVRARLLRESSTDVMIGFEITDSGIGMDEELIAHVFEPFWQGRGPAAHRTSGTGLGLAIARQFVELMGGNIEVRSAPGEGAQFRFSVRLHRSPRESRGVMGPLASGVSKMAAIAENPELRVSLSQLLERSGLDLVTFPTISEAVPHMVRAKGEGRPYEVVFFDGKNASVDLHTFLDLLESQLGLDRPYVIYLTSPVSPEPSGLAKVDAMLSKPVRQSALITALEGLTRVSAVAFGQPQPEVNSGPQTTFSDINILVVEDNDLNRQVALHQLRALGCEPDMAHNGMDGLRMMEEKQYEVIFMDCQMPGLDGYQTTAEIRKREAAAGPSKPSTHIVALTAYALTGDREKCLAAGMDDYLSKPVRPEQLEGALSRYLGVAQTMPSVIESLFDDGIPKASGSLDQDALTLMKESSPPGVFGELVKMFLHTAPEQLAGMENCAEQENWDGLARFAHGLGGSCSHFGAFGLMESCLSLERTAQNSQGDTARQLIAEVRTKLSDVLVELEVESREDVPVA